MKSNTQKTIVFDGQEYKVYLASIGSWKSHKYWIFVLFDNTLVVAPDIMELSCTGENIDCLFEDECFPATIKKPRTTRLFTGSLSLMLQEPYFCSLISGRPERYDAVFLRPKDKMIPVYCGFRQHTPKERLYVLQRDGTTAGNIPAIKNTSPINKQLQGSSMPTGDFIPDEDWSGIQYHKKYYALRNRERVKKFLKTLYNRKAFDDGSAITLKQAGVDRKWKTLFQAYTKFDRQGKAVKTIEAQTLEELVKCIGEKSDKGIKRVFIKM